VHLVNFVITQRNRDQKNNRKKQHEFKKDSEVFKLSHVI
jgi:hypothetical protein